MTKGGSNKPKMLGRLIFGEKRKQHASPSRHRSVPRNGESLTDMTPSDSTGVVNKTPIDVHDWAAWRMKLNEQMGNGMAERTDMKHMRQFLHGNSFYQQHSRDPSNGRYNGVRLLFSIPHAKLKSESAERSQETLLKTADQSSVLSNTQDPTITGTNAVSPMLIDKTIRQLLPKGLIGNTDDFLHINEQMIAADTMRSQTSNRLLNKTTDRIHSTLQKAVKDGNVLEKIKAFEMQAAAAQAGSTTKLNGGINTRLQSSTSSVQSTTHRTLSPAIVHRTQQPISPIIMQPDTHQQYVRSHRNRHVYPVQHSHREGHVGPIMNRESRKGAHVLEPAHGDIILKRRTPSQKTVNDDDYTMTAMSSMAYTTPQGNSHHHHRQHPRGASTSRSRHHHQQEMVHDKRSAKHYESSQKKNQQKQKETITTPAASSPKKSHRRRWLKGRKETPPAVVPEQNKSEVSESKFKKNSKNKKKNNEQEKLESIKPTTSPTPQGKASPSSDNSRVYGVPTTTVNDQTKSETTSLQLPSRIDEENESDREENKTRHMSPKEEDISQSKECNTIVAVERRPSKTKYHQKLSSTDGEILSKVDDDTRFSRPTDDHAHRSELNDEDDECKSEGDVFIEESSATNINSHHQQSSNTIQRQASQCSNDDPPSDRRWQWSKESGGLITKGNRKKNQQPPITLITRKNTPLQQEDAHIVYETPQSEKLHLSKKNQSSRPITKTGSNKESTTAIQHVTKPILHTNINSTNKTHQRQAKTDEFFEIGPHTNPEEAILQMTNSS